MTQLEIWTADLPGYKLLDSGNKKKLEEVSGIRLVRSEPRAWWQPQLPSSEWDKASAKFEHEKGKWNFKEGEPQDLTLSFEKVTLKLKFPANSKHFGVFPEQVTQWKWIGEQLDRKQNSRVYNVLSLFGYTGASSLVAAAHGARVTHVDGSRTVISWARENQEASGLNEVPIRWILDDAVEFVRREIKRGNKYDAIIMDPPSFGRGPKGQVWKIEENLVPFLKLCREILVAEPLFIVLNMYSTELSALTLKNLVEGMMKGVEGEVSVGELAIQEEKGRFLPLSIFANWAGK
jgi:23S rRNA (cytosine1962-C5)-methyltransferase